MAQEDERQLAVAPLVFAWQRAVDGEPGDREPTIDPLTLFNVGAVWGRGAGPLLAVRACAFFPSSHPPVTTNLVTRRGRVIE